jgi:hypothetical protein
MNGFVLLAQVYKGILKVAWTIEDSEGSEKIITEYTSKTIQFRCSKVNSSHHLNYAVAYRAVNSNISRKIHYNLNMLLLA